MILTVTPNPALDITYQVDHLKRGVSFRVTPLAEAGGKGLNVARVLAALGNEVSATGPLGGANGLRVRELLEKTAVVPKFIASQVPTRQTINVVDDSDATIFNEAGLPQTEELWERLSHVILAGRAKEVTDCGSFPPHTAPGTLTKLLAAARSAGSNTVVDTSGQALVAAAQAGADLLKPNEVELAEATGENALQAGATRLLGLGAKAVVCSRGAAGLSAFTPSLQVNVPPGVRLHGNPTGAGDSLVASLAASLAKTGEIPTSKPELTSWLNRASALAAATVAAPTAGAFDQALYQKLLEE